MNISFRLIKIETLQFAVLSDNAIGDAYNVNSGFEFGISSDKTKIRCKGEFVFVSLEGNPIMKLETACHFGILLSDVERLKQEDNTYKIPVGFLQHLAMIVVGTARGILFAKTENTAVNQLYLPLINLTDAIKNDFIVK